MRQMRIFEIDKPCLLMSLKQQYHSMIENGLKRYEYRRKFVDFPVNAYIYISYPVMKIMSYIEFGRPIIGSPKSIAKIAENDELGSGSRILNYLCGLKEGYAIPIIKFTRIKEVSLEEIRKVIPNFMPPQSYMYMSKKIRLLELLKNTNNYSE